MLLSYVQKHAWSVVLLLSIGMLSLALAVPLFAAAAVPANDGTHVAIYNPLLQKPIVCAFKAIFTALYTLGIPIAAFALALAGFLFVYARGNSQRLVIARSFFFKVVLYDALFLGSWLILLTLVNTLNIIIPGLLDSVASC